MTPKEKAEELYNRFCEVKAKKGKRIIPIEIKTLAALYADTLLESGLLKPRYCGYDKLEHSHIEYWQQVKTEIESMPDC